MKKLSTKRVAILATDGYEHSELFSPKKALENAGATVDIISTHEGEIKSWKDGNWGESISVKKLVKDSHVKDYDGLVLPGGVINPDQLRTDENAINFVQGFFKEGIPVAAICHAPQILISADVLKNRRITSYKSIKTDVINAGAEWFDEEVVVDQGLVTSRNPDDLPAFNNKIIEEIAEGKHLGQKKSVLATLNGETQ